MPRTEGGQPAHLQQTVSIPCSGDMKPVGPASRHIKNCADCLRRLYRQAQDSGLAPEHARYLDDVLDQVDDHVRHPSPDPAPFEVVDDAPSPDGSPRQHGAPRQGHPEPGPDHGPLRGPPQAGADPVRPGDDAPAKPGLRIAWVRVAHRPLPQVA